MKLFGKERDTMTLVAGVIVVYFWFFVSFFNAPTIFGEYYAVRLPLVAVGILIVKLFGNDDSLLRARLKTSKLVTSYGIFGCDGSVREVQSGSQRFLVFYEGINADGIYQRGDKVFICPKGMVKKAGHNWLLKADLKVNGTIPEKFEPYTVKMKYCLYGNTQSADFGNVTVQIQEISSRAKLQDETIKAQRALLTESLKMLSDKHAVKTMGSDELIDKLEKTLKGGQSP